MDIDGLGAIAAPIVTVTLNTALDITYELGEVKLGQGNRVEKVHAQAGGKGINVARTLHQRGRPTVAMGFTGGVTGEAVAADLAAAGIDSRLIPIAGETRRTVALHTDGQGETTELLEPGPEITPLEWFRFVDVYVETIQAASVVVLSGSLPPGLPADAYAVLCRKASELGIPTILDSSGEALRQGLAAPQSVVKPNAHEMRELLATYGRDTLATPAAGASFMRTAFGVPAVVVSLGAGGLLAAVGDDVIWEARTPGVSGNPVGAGDAVAAGLAEGMAAGLDWPDRLRLAVTLGAAAVAHPIAGGFDTAVAQSLASQVVVKRSGEGEA